MTPPIYRLHTYANNAEQWRYHPEWVTYRPYRGRRRSTAIGGTKANVVAAPLDVAFFLNTTKLAIARRYCDT